MCIPAPSATKSPSGLKRHPLRMNHIYVQHTIHATKPVVFERLTPSLQKEILRYIHHLKGEDSIDRNVTKAINFLLGEARFIGRNKP